jgi:hypothetical protein
MADDKTVADTVLETASKPWAQALVFIATIAAGGYAVYKIVMLIKDSR